MATTRNSSVENNSVEEDIQSTIMAIREVLMTYYKGSCVENLVNSHNVSLHSVADSGGYYYQRLDRDIKQPSVLVLADVTIARLGKSPDKIILYSSVLKRSKEFRMIQENMITFLQRFLKNVEIERKEGAIINGQ